MICCVVDDKMTKGNGTSEKDMNTPLVRARGTGPVDFRSILLVLLTALLLWLSYPPVGWGWLGLFALMPLGYAAVSTRRPKQMMLWAWGMGWLWWLWVMHWLSMVTWPGYLVGCLYLAVYWGLALGGIRLLYRHLHLPLVIVLPLVWVSGEFVRGYWPAGGYGWFALAQTQGSYLPGQGISILAQVADLFGEWTIGLVLACFSGGLLDGIIASRDFICRWRKLKGKTDAGQGHTQPLLSIRDMLVRPIAPMLGCIVLGAAILYGLIRPTVIQQAYDKDRSLLVAAIQTNDAQDNRNSPTAQQVLDMWRSALTLAVEAHVAAGGTVSQEQAEPDPVLDLIALPEGVALRSLNEEAVEGYEKVGLPWGLMRQDTMELAGQLLGTDLLLGANYSAGFEEVKVDGKAMWYPRTRYNSVYHFGGDGQEKGRYDKVHLVPFGEFVPWVDAVPGLRRLFLSLFSPYGPDVDYEVKPGADYVRFQLQTRSGETWRLATPICFEDTVPKVTRAMVYEDGRKQVDLLVNHTNDGWYAGTSQTAQHLQIASLRCIELSVPMLRSVNGGGTSIIDANGQVVTLAAPDENGKVTTGYVIGRIHPNQAATLFGQLGTWPMFGLTITTLLLLLLATFIRWSSRRQIAVMDESKSENGDIPA